MKSALLYLSKFILKMKIRRQITLMGSCCFLHCVLFLFQLFWKHILFVYTEYIFFDTPCFRFYYGHTYLTINKSSLDLLTQIAISREKNKNCFKWLNLWLLFFISVLIFWKLIKAFNLFVRFYHKSTRLKHAKNELYSLPKFSPPLELVI